MAFDQSTRNRLQKFVNDARNLLTEEFTRQLQATYGLDPKAGSVAAVDSLTHLDNRQRQVANLLREIVNHYVANSSGKNEKEKSRQALDRLVREQGFTILNRIAALRMAEARGLLIESVAKGYNSKGFQLYKMVAGTSHGETGDAYRNYLYSLFDEFSIDLELLFSRHSAQGQLFPRETALLELLEQINHHEIEQLWAEDETIGWIYQYYNSQEERKKMRKESQAPRTSRELAVRNQFFTPRYVVEFLVDNTLGRLWFDATAGKTNLYGRCQYLLVKPEELEEKRSSTPPTTIRDPRSLKLLDPACGSMHFGLYAFDLFLEIYREAWAWEQEHGPGSLDTSAYPEGALLPLDQVYASESDYLRDVPRLIIEHNIYGVDIDPRAAQIATLALWLRAQRAWHESSIKAQDRPTIARGHVLAAVAPPAEQDLRERFAAQLDTLDGELFTHTLQLLKSVPEQGVLLQIEKELPRLVRKVFGEHGGLFKEADEQVWQKAEERLRAALTDFAEAGQGSFQDRLYAQDALWGLRLIDLCHEVFDVVVMNPPFGDPSRSTKAYLETTYPRSKGNILTHFIERSTQLVRDGGRVGAIVSRTCFFLQSFSEFRKSVLAEDLALESFVDLGQGVLDAMVETAAVTWQRSEGTADEAVFFRELNRADKNSGLLESIHLLKMGSPGENYFTRRVEQFSVFDDMPYVYWISESIARKIASQRTIEPSECAIRVGLQTGDDFRFLRLWWEVSSDQVVVPFQSDDLEKLRSQSIELSKTKRWAWYSKTESASPILSSIHLYVNWLNNGAEIKAYHIGNGHSASKYVMSESMYFRPGLSYMLRSSRLVPYIVPLGVIPTAGRSQVYPKEGKEIWLATLLSSNLATAVARFRGEAFWQPKFQNSMVSAIPYIEPESNDSGEASYIVANIRKRMAESFKKDETEILFNFPAITDAKEKRQSLNRETLIGAAFDERIANLCGLSKEEFITLQRDHNESLKRSDSTVDEEADHQHRGEEVTDVDPNLDELSILQSWAVGVAFGHFDLRLATGEREAPAEPEPFDPLPTKSPGMLPDDAEPFHAHPGILVDDEGHAHDLPYLLEEVLQRVDVSVQADTRRWLQRDCFSFHLQRYSKSRRKAPIYWPLATLSGGYTLWLYYPALTSQTLFTAVNDFIEPKLQQVRGDLESLRGKGNARSKQEEKQLETATDLAQELADLRDALLAIAPKYSPNHDDGVQITAAPLWQLFRHKPWQKVLKDTWEKLEQGDYDWAHLAMNYWPERVLRKCHQDRSLAIAHDVECTFWHEVEVPVKRGKKATGETKLEWQPKELTDNELDALIQAKIKEKRA
ncbi:MAG: BREX-1 system adenine-specific DNA-methyltransferase PglX [Candidatus Thiodiazotropha endolucinida]|nr:BREX-1 system adenine-specific DNA-methyltransferase PglX [Candidatus Thiodiazotropha taylori]MCG8092897.1 BREX-1 system adenine-specific DNA-methyltransferase PglX [Candidatus Thiodiazotropha endolucinida]MCG7881208.1 BREX-1 system adenine-specific DNA-methyltransferase PglX [Candidatus Thiodiazotropha taylori]MCG7887007.1 BREX-1 system adenine-specific DNA-methyltransferase PglX [Candidatus Thiodiazotropha taylori]MCG7951160.1 BREX-1 system adenine-specific DNA-methyltransferase PglX [Cand